MGTQTNASISILPGVFPFICRNSVQACNVAGSPDIQAKSVSELCLCSAVLSRCSPVSCLDFVHKRLCVSSERRHQRPTLTLLCGRNAFKSWRSGIPTSRVGLCFHKPRWFLQIIFDHCKLWSLTSHHPKLDIVFWSFQTYFESPECDWMLKTGWNIAQTL